MRLALQLRLVYTGALGGGRVIYMNWICVLMMMCECFLYLFDSVAFLAR